MSQYFRVLADMNRSALLMSIKTATEGHLFPVSQPVSLFKWNSSISMWYYCCHCCHKDNRIVSFFLRVATTQDRHFSNTVQIVNLTETVIVILGWINTFD